MRQARTSVAQGFTGPEELLSLVVSLEMYILPV